MKTILTLLLFAALSSAVMAQDIAGKWEGKIDVNGGQLHLVFHVTKDGAGYKTTMDSPDQNAMGLPVSSTTIKEKSVTFDMPNLGGVFEGTITDANTITGNWKQAGQTFPLVLTKAKSDK